MPTRLAACTCGQLTATTTGEPVRISVCHCHACQRRTGSVFGVQARFPQDAVTVAGDSTVFARTGDAGTTARFHFCPVCGATVYYLMDAIPGMVAIPDRRGRRRRLPAAAGVGVRSAPPPVGAAARQHRKFRVTRKLPGIRTTQPHTGATHD